MVALDLRFVQDKTEDGSLVYRLDPYVPFLGPRNQLNSRCSPVDVFVTYDGKRSSDIAISRYAIRQLVANEVGIRFSRRDSQLTFSLKIDARVSSRQAGGVSTGKPERKGLFGKR
jgi:chromosome transmission fidelity protein 18